MRSRILDRKRNACVAGALLLLAAATSHATNNLDCSSANDGRSKLLRVVGLTDDGALVCFSELAPRRVRDIGYVSGLVPPDVRLIGIDFRVQTGALYGVGDLGGVYVSTSNAVGTLISQLTVELEGSKFGVDFNPAADRLRIVSDTGQNLRHNVNEGGATAVDLALNYTAGTPTLGVTAVLTRTTTWTRRPPPRCSTSTPRSTTW